MFLSVFCGFLMPQVIRFVVDAAAANAVNANAARGSGMGGASFIGRVPVGLLVMGIALVGGASRFLHQKTLAMASEGLIKRLRDVLFSHIQRLPYEWHAGIQTGDIVQRCTSDVEIVRGFAAAQFVEIVHAAALVVFAYSMLYPINAVLSLASFAWLPVVFFYSLFFLRRVSADFLAADEAEGQLLSIAQENFTGVRVVRAFGRERYEAERFERQNRHYAALWVRLGRLLSTYWGLGDTLTGLQMVTICALGAYQAADGALTIGEFIVFLSYNAMTIWPVRGLGRVLTEAGKAGVSLGRIREILDAPPETDPPAGALDGPIDGDIEFDHVTFAYGDNAPVLRDVSFRAARGTTLGILGATGSGKTTIAHLLCRLYDLRKGCGQIRIGGTDIRKFKRARLRESVGIVLQEPFLFSRTIRENIASFSPLPLESVREAAALAQVDETITRFAAGYDTSVGERGVTLSGGQKQRVAIARTVLRDSSVLIFDDSLSAVDTETDAKIGAALRRRAKGVTTLVIAHRVSSVSWADAVMVMENGRVAEFGSPAELLARGGLYKRLHDMQSFSADLSPVEVF
ncbi:MAG: ABC transporter ATP-binding protein/permease [Synergistaceae bacterium]|jgi:ATP-binding cassette subfamily B protein|nr:ABC transporter ATP-binding protein/permease [Synergistaceae bacterium]